MKAYCAFLAAILVFFTAGFARADNYGGRWWRIPRLVERLNLTSSQVESLEKSFHRARLNMIKLKSRVEAEQFELESMLEAENFEEAAAMAQYRKLEKARTELGVERFRFLVDVRKILGRKAFQELMQIKRLREQRKVPGKKRPLE